MALKLMRYVQNLGPKCNSLLRVEFGGVSRYSTHMGGSACCNSKLEPNYFVKEVKPKVIMDPNGVQGHLNLFWRRSLDDPVIFSAKPALNFVPEPGHLIFPKGVPPPSDRNFIDAPLHRNNEKSFEDPVHGTVSPKEDPSQKDGVNSEKRAARLVVIRRIKMNKHKLKKFRKRMKYVIAKRELRREMRKERQFLDRHLARIRAAERFDAKEHVQMLIAKAKEKPTPTKYKGKKMPHWWIKQRIDAGDTQYLS